VPAPTERLMRAGATVTCIGQGLQGFGYGHDTSSAGTLTTSPSFAATIARQVLTGK
jgi:hypothetical protein